MKRALITVLLVVSLVAGATVAEAAVTTGKFRGNIKQGGKISIKVSKVNGKKRVTRLAWSGVPSFACEDDGDGNPADDAVPASSTGGEATNQSIKIKEGKFTANLSNPDESIEVTIKGKFNSAGDKITGTWRMVQHYNLDDELDPAGPTDCDSGERKYSAPKQ